MKKWIWFVLPSSLILGATSAIVLSCLQHKTNDLVQKYTLTGESTKNENVEEILSHNKDENVDVKTTNDEVVTTKLLETEKKQLSTIKPVLIPKLKNKIFVGDKTKTPQEFIKQWNKKHFEERIDYLFGNDSSISAETIDNVYFYTTVDDQIKIKITLLPQYAFDIDGKREMELDISFDHFLPKQISLKSQVIRTSFIGNEDQSFEEFISYCNEQDLQDQIKYFFGSNSPFNLINTKSLLLTRETNTTNEFNVTVNLHKGYIFDDSQNDQRIFSNLKFNNFQLKLVQLIFKPKLLGQTFIDNKSASLEAFVEMFNKKNLPEKIDYLFSSTTTINKENTANITLFIIDKEKNIFGVRVQLINGFIFNDTGKDNVIFDSIKFIPRIKKTAKKTIDYSTNNIWKNLRITSHSWKDFERVKKLFSENQFSFDEIRQIYNDELESQTLELFDLTSWSFKTNDKY